ncbi:MAG: acyltransferase [Anaerolineae bacterium]|nr:acyltransferase [Anaerolineae bacterium]
MIQQIGNEASIQKKDLKVRKALADSNKSTIAKYQDFVVGRGGWASLIKYELIITLCSWLPGALGLLLRSKLYPLLLGKVGRNVIFGTNVMFRHPHKIFIGDNVVIDDNCFIDAKGVRNKGIFIGNDVFLGRNGILSCKDGDIHLEDGVNIGFNCEIFSSNKVILRKNALVAAYCYFVGGGNYDLGRTDISFAEQEGLDSKGGIDIGANSWIAASTTVLDGVTIGQASVVGAGAVVRDSIPDNSIAVGVPARIVKAR